ACTDPALESLRRGVRNAFAEDRPWISSRLRLGQDPSSYWVFTAVPNHGPDGAVDGVALYAEDVTQRRRAEDEERLGKIRLMVEHAQQVAMALFDSSGHLMQASERFTNMIHRVRGLDP